MTAPGYVMVDVGIVDAAKYQAYKDLASLAMKAHGAEVLIRGGNANSVEGNWQPGRIVLLKFPSVAAAHAYINSPEYEAARCARTGAASMNMIVVEGVGA